MKIILCSINSKYIHSSLGVWYLYSAAKKYDNRHDVQVYEGTINNQIEDIITDLSAFEADVIGFSTYIWNVDYVNKIAQTIKKINPKVTIFLGGPEASFDALRLIEKPYVDFIIKGEGEGAFIKLLAEDFNPEENEENRGEAPTDKSKRIISGACCEYINPYSDEYFKALKGRICYLETSRGCPFNCGFCLSGRDENVRFFELSEAKRNIIALANSGTKTVKFVDRTFNCNDKRGLEIFKFIHEEYEKGNIPHGVIFHFEVEADLFTKETLAYLKTVPKGLFQFEAGLQSFNPITLKAVNRRSDIAHLVDNLRSIVAGGNIHLHIDLIAGLPFEGYDSFTKGFNLAYEIKANVIQLGFLKLLKGSDLESNKAQYGYSYTDYSPYQVICNDSISYQELSELKKAEDAVERLYNSGRFAFTIEYLLKHSGLTAYEIFYNFGKFVQEKGEKSPSLSLYAQLLYDFFCKVNGVDEESFRDAMAVDRIITDNTGRLFPFAHIIDERYKDITYV
ncbi:MAG: DUF4080 domain-containing protein, partial [Oscillospiraceae bacterium]